MDLKDICCVLNTGDGFMRRLGGETEQPFLPIGNALDINVTHDITNVQQPSSRQLGGIECELPIINAITLNLTLGCLKARNLALAMQGDGSFENIPTGSVEDEEHTVLSVGQLIPTEYIPEANIEVTSDAETPVEYEAGVDYILSPGGIIIPEGSSIPMDSKILISYDYGIGTIINALTNSASEWEFMVVGINQGSGGQKVRFHAFRVKIGPTDTLPILNTNQEFHQITLTAQILRDSSRYQGSQFYKYEFGNMASGM